jgi:hypothetical protein
MLLKYRPEDKAAKKERLLNKAKAEAEGKTLETKKPIVVKYGINHVTYLIEQVPEISRFKCLCELEACMYCFGAVGRPTWSSCRNQWCVRSDSFVNHECQFYIV